MSLLIIIKMILYTVWIDILIGITKAFKNGGKIN